MKKIYMILAAMTLLSMSLNAQIDATKKVDQTQQTAPTGKKADTQLGVAKMALNPTSHRAPSRAAVEHVSTLTFTAACGGSGTADDGATWTVTSDASESTYDATLGIHYGTNRTSVSYIRLETSDIPGTIKSVVVNAARASQTTGFVSVTVGGAAFGGSAQTLTSSAANYTFTGEASGTILVNIYKNTSQNRALYCKSITVTYETEEGGEGTSDLTVCDGQYNAQVLPVLGYFHDESQHNQMIYPASMLSAMAGKTIKSMTFYPTSGSFDANSDGTNETYNGINFYGGSVTFKLMNLSSGTPAFAEENPTLITGTMTQVSTVVPQRNTSATTWVINFDQDFKYTGGDLLIDVTNVAGTWGVTFFTVDAMQNNAGMYSYVYNGSTSSAGLDFLPKVTFTYEGEPNPVHDLAIALSAPAQAGAGSTVDVTVTVTNNGEFAENGYTVTVSDGTNIVNITAQEELGIGETATFTVQFATSANAGGSTVNYTATVACTDDAVTDNNSATASTSLLACPPPINVAATSGNNHNATMTWDAPNIPSIQQSFIWDFESESQANEWTLVNADNDNYNWTWDGSGGFKTHSGNGIMYSESYVNYVGALYPDNWMISPEVNLGGSFTLWACGQDTQGYHKEHFGVFVYQGSYSSGTSGFVQVGSIIETNADMTEYTFDLSQFSGTGRIAIRHFDVTDQYRLNVDDISYQVSVTGEQPVSYNIYLDGQLVGNVPSTTFSYDFSNVSDGQHTCAVSAVYSYGESVAVPTTFTISSQPQTPAPTIAISSQTDNQVTITATGNGTVTLTINGQTVEGNGSASITVPRQMQDYVVSASATAQASGELVSETTTQNLTIPGMASSGEWTEMIGTYDNPNALLSFKVKVGNDTTDIMMIDQFLAPTVNNDHPSSYTYVLKEKINGEEKSSNPATVPVYKTNSTMYSLYTEEEVLADNKYDDNKLKANVLNSEIDYDVVPDNNVLYYSLYRGGKDEPTPVVDVDHRISQLQKFEDKVGDNVTYYLTENHLSGITPRYEHIGSQIVERLDMDYVTGTDENKLSYVPVIWTFGLYTARGDGKNNSYGSDIKNSYVGKVNISVEGYKNDGNNTTGQWKDGEGTTYCVYSPKITLNGFTPDDGGANDDDTYQYVPYMYRVWCTYPNAHNFTLLANPDGKVHLADAGPITAPFLIGEATAEDSVWHNNGEEVIIGRALASGEAQQPWSFGVPVTEPSKNVEFVARFYYKKIVTPAAQANGLRGNRGSERAFAIAENSADGKDIVTGINELADIVYVVSTTYVNAQGMQSDVPFDGLNIVITRYSDGTTSTTKVVR